MVYISRKYGRRFQGFKRRRVMRRKVYGARGARGRIVRAMNPTPTFVETFSQSPIPGNAGGVFAVRISDMPQMAQYATLYKQYRINWIKVTLVPDWNSVSADQNAAAYNASLPIQNFGMARIAYAVNDSPQLVNPATEAVVLADNGCKIKPIGAKWSASFKPVPDVGVITGTTGATIYTKSKFKQWFNFEVNPTHFTDNPLHYGLSYYITQVVANTQAAPTYNVYYKVSFTLRDPQ